MNRAVICRLALAAAMVGAASPPAALVAAQTAGDGTERPGQDSATRADFLPPEPARRFDQSEGQYPDLRAAPALELSMGTEVVGGRVQYVLRFPTEIWNAGPGPLELIGVSGAETTLVYQRVFDPSDAHGEFPVGEFIFHPAHNHWHFEGFVLHELWTMDAFERWLASGRTEGEPQWRGNKTTGGGESLCIRDTGLAVGHSGRLGELRYNGCDRDVQGISVGWSDIYPPDLPGQWIDLGAEPLADGDYALRLVVDPGNRILESSDRADPARESPEANEAVTVFTVRDGSIVGLPRPLHDTSP